MYNQHSSHSNPLPLLPSATAFQQIVDGNKTDLYVLQNATGTKAAITNFGARLVSLLVPDKNGYLTDVVLGFASLSHYLQSTERYYGATIGRYANRIANGTFQLNGEQYQLACNNGSNHLHGGVKGFQEVVWDAEQISSNSLQMSYTSADMEEGYPGNLQVKVTYTLSDEHELMISYEAFTDKDTVINLTNHAFFNLNGEGSGSASNHMLTINSNDYTPVNDTLIPTGEIATVENTPFDFRTATEIGARINTAHEQLIKGNGYDHNFVLDSQTQSGIVFAAKATGDKSGIVMQVYTEEPGLQLYTGNFMKGTHILKSGATDECRTAFCLETQHYPDSPNHPSFPSTRLRAGEVYTTKSVYCFSIQE